MREVERQVMLRIIDQRWREHLYEMDYLQEGINLRAMGQKDPLVEWQREGFEMFGAMMKGIAQDFVRYVMHVQVVQQRRRPAHQPCRTCSSPRPTTCSPAAPAARRSARPAGAGEADAGGRRRAAAGAQAAADREGRVGEDAAQRAVPVRSRQEVQDVPRGGKSPLADCASREAWQCSTTCHAHLISPTTSA